MNAFRGLRRRGRAAAGISIATDAGAPATAKRSGAGKASVSPLLRAAVAGGAPAAVPSAAVSVSPPRPAHNPFVAAAPLLARGGGAERMEKAAAPAAPASESDGEDYVLVTDLDLAEAQKFVLGVYGVPTAESR